MAIFHAMHVSAKPRELSGGAGSNNLAISREAFLRAQGFNPNLWVGEDWDLIRRLRGAGYRIYFDPRFAVLHNSRRDTRSKVIEHARSYGRGYFLLMQQGLLPAPKTRMDFLGGHAPTAWLWSVFRATAQTAQLFLQHPAMLAYLRALPAVWLFYFVRRQEILREAAKTQGYSTGSCDK